MSDSSEDSEYTPTCGDCKIPLDYTRDGHEDDEGRCHNCYWEEENTRARREKDIVELEPEYRPSDWLKKNRPHIWEQLNKKETKRKSEEMTGGTPDETNTYNAQLKRLGEIIVKRISDEIQKSKFLEVYPSIDELAMLTELENRYKALSEVISQRTLSFGLENVIAELRDIEIRLQKDRFDKEQLDEGDYYEFALARYLSKVNKRFPEDTIPHLRPWEDKQLPDAAGPVGGKRKKSKKTKKSKNPKKPKKTRKMNKSKNVK